VTWGDRIFTDEDIARIMRDFQSDMQTAVLVATAKPVKNSTRKIFASSREANPATRVPQCGA
jgi:hypothetical protein